jgi:hypothetical protein
VEEGEGLGGAEEVVVEEEGSSEQSPSLAGEVAARRGAEVVGEEGMQLAGRAVSSRSVAKRGWQQTLKKVVLCLASQSIAR